ncbi:MAG: Zn-dependent hydrolase [Bacteroidia bacterium]|nr:MAG: Zn-dependent hydrolase [Bacteroidia bacterium]
MYRFRSLITGFIFFTIILVGCQPTDREYQEQLRERIAQYEEVVLTTDLSHLTEQERDMISFFISAADIVDNIFWMQSYGSKEQLMDYMTDRYARAYARINYGPWGRLEGHTPFYPGFEDKPLGANFYPPDMDREEFNNWDHPDKRSPYTMIRRATDGSLVAIPYATAFADWNEEIAVHLRSAAIISEYKPFANYLDQLADALLTDDYRESDMAWMQMRDNNIDLVLRPLDTGEDRKFGHKAAHSAYIVVKDHERSGDLKRFIGMVPELQARLPVPDRYKQEVPGDDSDIGVYDAIYYAGHCNAGPKIIALHLPHNPEVQQKMGTRSMQLSNVMEAKFDGILKPIGNMMIHEDQRDYVSFDAFFHLTAFHEIAGGLGISNTVTGEGSVRDALREYHGVIDATVSDLMALYLITQLQEMGELTEEELKQAYVTAFASVMRSSRFGTAGAHGTAGMIRFNFFAREEAFARCQDTDTYLVDFDNMRAAVEKAVEKLLIIQGDGDYNAAQELITSDGAMSETLQGDIDRINNENIPVDVVFLQGLQHLDL